MSRRWGGAGRACNTTQASRNLLHVRKTGVTLLDQSHAAGTAAADSQQQRPPPAHAAAAAAAASREGRAGAANMDELEVSRQIENMCRFIKQEAEEKSSEIRVSAEEVRRA